MKRLGALLSACGACVWCVTASEIPSEDEWPGWLSPAPAEWTAAGEGGGGAASLGASASASLPPLAEALAAAPAAVPSAQPFDLGLSTNVAKGSDDLVMETARGLGCNWARCYLYVRGNIRFVPCRGIQRGPERTLLDGEGGDGDQALLLAALLRASGHADAKVCYVSRSTGGFQIPLGGSEYGYDAAAWTGASTNGTVTDVLWSTIGCLSAAMIQGAYKPGTTLQDCELWAEHFWVRLTLDGQEYDLDPSFKPRRQKPQSASILSDMGYSRTNLLAAAGGTTNALCVQGLSFASVSAELRRLTANLAAAWRAAGPDAKAEDFVGCDEVAPQDVAADAATCHGVIGGTAVDFLSQPDSAKNAMRFNLKIVHAGFTNTVWLDEIGSRRLWLSYTNSAQAYPRAVLHLDDTVLAAEPAGSGTASDTLALTVTHPFSPSTYACTYTISRGLSNVYAIPVGFGSPGREGMRERAQSELERVYGSGAPASDLNLRACVLQVVGQQWLSQTAMMGGLNGRFEGAPTHFFYNIGLAAQTASPYVDLKNCLTHSTRDVSKFSAYNLFASALEHAALDQVNGTNAPAVSTVRVVCLANAANKAIYFATTGNWSTVRSSLTNYTTTTLGSLDTAINTNKRKALLPQSGTITLNNWSSYAYIDYGPSGSGYSTSMIIGGGLAGGYASRNYVTPAPAVQSQYASVSLPSRAVSSFSIADPLDARSGAFQSGHADLSLAGPLPLALARRYDSRQRSVTGSFGKGWSHAYDAKAVECADPDAFAGRGAPAACAASAVACAVANDLLAAGENAKNMALACLVVQWWTDCLAGGAVSVQTDGGSLSFVRQPDGSYIPPPGVTASLVRSNDNAFVLSRRLGPAWRFDAKGCLVRVEDASGNHTGLAYGSLTNVVAVSNSFGGKLTFAWSGNRVSSVSDSAGRSVSYAYSAAGCLTSVTDAAGCVWKYAYDANDALVSETDPDGTVTVRNAYNALGQVTNQLSATGRASAFAYAAGRRTLHRDPLGAVAVSEFDADGRLAGRTEPDGTSSATSYDAQGQAVTNADALGRIAVRVYDASNRLVRVTEAANTPDARTTSYGYDSRHRPVAVTNALGRVTRMAYDACDRLALTLNPDGSSVTNAYDSRGLAILTRTLDATGRILSETATAYDARGFAVQVASADAGTTRFGYDAAGNPTGVTNALGFGSRTWYDARGLPTNTLDALGGRTRRTYTPAGRPASETDPLGRVTRTSWTPGGKQAATVFPDGGVATNEYDGADRLVASADPRGNRVVLGLDLMGRATNRCGQAWSERTWYDPAGLATARVDAVGGRTATDYDWLDRPTASTDPLGRTRLSAYDALGSLSSSTDPRGRVTAYAYDLAGRRARTRYPSGRTEANAYDALGRRVAFTNAENRVYRMGYDGQGRLLAATNAAGEQVVRNFYDAAGNLTNAVDAASRRTAYRYDALNRLTRTLYADGAWEGFGYDAVGNLTSASNSLQSTAYSLLTFSYDAMDRLTSSVTRVSGQTFAVRCGYDLGGLRTNVVYPDGRAVRYGYDADGRVASVTDWAGHTWTFTRDAAGRLTALSCPNGVSGAWSYDANHAVASWSWSAGGSPFAGREITRDAAGIKTEEHVSAGLFPNPRSPRRAQNAFDAADRLVSATVATDTNTVAETYRYDACGALTNIASGSATTFRATYDALGRVASVGGLACGYDAAGNRVVAGGRIWVPDHADPLKRPLMEADANGVPVRTYVWGGGMLLAVVEADGTARYCHGDDLGSVVAVTDASGTVTDQYCYGPYGEDWGHSGTNGIPFRWLGSHGVVAVGYLSPLASSLLPHTSSLYLTRHRLYSAALCRFLSPDPSGLSGGPNLYAYCLGNPLAYIDPQGLSVSAAGIGLTSWGTYSFGQSASVRDYYASAVAKLDGFDIAGRTSLKISAREMTPQPMLAIIEAQRPTLGPSAGSIGNANVSNLKWNNVGQQFGAIGNGLAMANIAMSGSSIAFAPQGQKLETLAAVSGATIVGAGGGIGGAATGAFIGSLGGPIGSAIGAAIGAFGGSLGGGLLGAEAGRNAYQLNTPEQWRY